MKKTTNLRSALLNAALLTAVSQVHAAPLYWDVNGSTAGSGNAGGTWENGFGNWTANVDGTGPAAVFNNGDDAIFSAGTDGIGAFTVNLNGTIATPLILLEEAGLVTLAGGTLDITGGTTINTSTLGATGGNSLTWSPAISGTGTLTIAGHGDTSAGGGGSNTIFTLSGTNTFTGDVVITSGVIGYLSDLGNAANKVVLDGGGIVNNNTGTFARNLEAGPSGGAIRNYGSATTTHTGVLSGAGTFRRTDGGNFIVTQTSTHTGPWGVERGTLSVGNGTQATDLLASSGVITLGDAGAGATLRYNLDSDFTWTRTATDLVFGNAGSVLTWQPNQAGQVLTFNNATSLVDATLGKIFIPNGEVKIASGADVKVRDIGVASTNSANARLAVEAGAALTTRYVNIGDGNATGGTVNQTGGTVTVQSGNNGFRLGHWSNGANPGSIYNLSGGTLDTTDLAANAGEGRWANIGWDGQGTMTVGGTGVLKAAGIRLDRNRAGSANYACTLTVNPGGTVEIGSLGTEGQGTNDAIILAGGTLKATSNSNWGTLLAATAATDTTIDVNGFIPRITNSASGTGTVTVTDSGSFGSLEIDSGTGARTWTPVLAGDGALSKVGTGTLVLDGSHTNSSEFLVSQGRLTLNGSLDNSLLDINDGATLGGEGVINGDLRAGFSAGADLAFNPATPGALAVNGGVELIGTNYLVPDAPFLGTRSVLTYTGSLTGGAANLDLEDSASYRSVNITAAGGSISLDIAGETLAWTGAGGGLWDLNTTGAWDKAGPVADNFYFGDFVVFDDSPGVTGTTATITGIIKPGLMTVDSSVNNFTWNGDVDNYIAGFGSLLKKGTSTLSINAPNTFTGGTVISNGRINIRSNSALGSGTVTLGDGDTGAGNVALYLDTNRVNFGTPVVVSNNGTGTATLGSADTITGTGDNNQFTNITLARDVIFDSNAGDRTDYENIKGTGNVTVTGTARSVFPTTPAAWTGDLTVSTSGANGALQVGVASTAGDRIPDASNVTVTAGGLMRLSTTAETIAGLNGAGTVNTNAPSGGTATLTVGFGGAAGDFSGLLTGGPNTLALAKTGAGTQILSGNNTYTGTTAINGGTLQVGAGGATGDLGTGAVTLAAGTTLTYNRTGAVVQEGGLGSGAAGAGILNVNGDATTAVTLNAGGGFSGVVNINNGSLIFGATNPTATAANAPTFNIAAGGILSNAGTSNHGHIGALNLTGGATVTTGSGTGSYNGENYQLNGTVTVAGGSTAALITREAGRTNANSGLALGILNGAKVFDVADVTGNSAADLIVDTELENSDSGAGALTKTGTGTLLLNAINSYTGGTIVSAGTLGGTGTILGPVTTASGTTLAPGTSAGVFTINGDTDLEGSLAIEVDGAQSDVLVVSGNLDITDASLAVTTLATPNQPAYVIATYGTLTGASFGGGITGVPGGYSVVYDYDDGFTTSNIALVQTGGDSYSNWEIANGIAGAGADVDSDDDGIDNGIEFVIGGDPSGPGSNSNALLPTVTTDATYLNFTFRRTDDSAPYGPFVEYGSTLQGWTEAEAGVNGVIINETNDIEPGVDSVEVKIPRSLADAPGTEFFARLRVDIP